MTTDRVGLDSQCLSFLIDIIYATSRPREEIAEQQLALLRIYLYGGITLEVTASVNSECMKIRNNEYADSHSSFMRTLFGVSPIKNPSAISYRADFFQEFHVGKKSRNDCEILAEAEDAGFDVLLTFDTNFYTRLSEKVTGIRLMQPTAYWLELAIPRGANLRTVPHYSNPLAQQNFWQW